MPSQISEQTHRPKNITRKDIACFANAQQKPKLYSTNHSIAKDQNQMEMENKRKRSSNGKCSLACWDNLVSDPDTSTRVMLDASIRRFKIQQIYLKASAALRWLTSRTAILGGNRPQPIHTPALQQIANTMRAVRFSSPYLFFLEILQPHVLSYAIEAVKMHDDFHSRALSSEARRVVHFSGQRC